MAIHPPLGDAAPRKPRRGPPRRSGVGRTDPGAVLMERPGVLIRRLHQVHSAMFQEECAAFGVTPVQYSLLTLLAHAPGLEQGVAAAGLRLDRFTTADVVRRLEAAKLLLAKRGQDRRAKMLFLTRRGTEVFAAMQSCVARAHDRMVEPLPERRRGPFLRLLRQLVEHHSAIGDSAPKVR